MRDFRSVYSDRECVEGFILTDMGGVMKVQAFSANDSLDYVWVPEHGWSIPRTSLYDTFEKAKAAAITKGEQSVKWAQERLEKAKNLKEEE